ncbi:hypothetical protein [Nostoc sp. MS1]|uniref:hypothetical protein n=1 Tax=Nostoc sp. MS1 TaxID=2764711 RepID=UPI001CC683AA|nr:hypothetical protein [Nostoc sp. MS1]BCL36651.1 hypothetical protein NSMS1_30980 [Nostoc sp. MS1]
MKYLKTKLVIKILILVSLLLISQQVFAQSWRPVRGSILYGISGVALISQENSSRDFLVVHDNKQSNQERLAILTIKDKNQPEYLSLNWPTNTQYPIDLEALTSIPKLKDSFIALSSTGKAYHVKLDRYHKNISVLKEFELPGIAKGSNFEALALQNVEGRLIAIWAHRGEGEEPATIYWGVFNLNKYQINLIGSTQIRVPFPSGNVRHISDTKVDSAGIVYISSASDAGDNGPFQSAIYVAGYLGLRDNKIIWQQNSQLIPLYRFNYHKVEGIELIPGADGCLVVGTDDENFGAYVYMLGDNIL